MLYVPFVDQEPDWVDTYKPTRRYPRNLLFSPFDLLYGRKVYDPLALVIEYWEG